MSTITIASLFRWMCWWFRFLWQTKFIFTIHKKRLLYSPWKPFSNWFTSRFQDMMREIKKKRKLFKDYLFIFLNHFRWWELPRCKAIVVQEFWPDSLSLPLWSDMVFNLSLRIDSPIFNYCFYGTFLHFSLQVLHTHNQSQWMTVFLSLEYLLLLPRSVLITISYNITLIFQHYDHIFLQLRTSSLNKAKKSFFHDQLLSTASPSPQFQRHPFSGLIHSAGELLHTP